MTLKERIRGTKFWQLLLFLSVFPRPQAKMEDWTALLFKT